MLYKYHYPDTHKLGKLNEYFVDFIKNIKDVKKTARFSTKYFPNDFEPIVNRSGELKKKFEAFFNTFKKLNDLDKDKFYRLFIKSQDIPNYFLDISIDCSDIKSDEINNLINSNTFKILTDHLFKTTLRTFDIDGHYKLIYNAMPYKLCPFCGVEIMHKSYREDYDHLAAKSLYPFLAIHPKNLAPTCHSCNSKNKGEKDLIYKGSKRTKLIYPYTESLTILFDYEGSIIPQTDKANQSGVWKIKILPDDDITQNWNKIYGIKKRYIEDFIEPSFEDWINDFISDCIDSGKNLSKVDIITSELKMLSGIFNKKWYQHSNIIKGPLFDYLSRCNNTKFYNSIIEKYNKKFKSTTT